MLIAVFIALIIFFTTILIIFDFLQGRKKKDKKIIKVSLVVLALVSLVLVYYTHIGKMIKQDYGYVRWWNTFHYYLGSKYFKELGYFDLYSCALLADESQNQVWGAGASVRNLYTYEITTRENIPPCLKENFSLERWPEFQADFNKIKSLDKDNMFSQVILDKGYNPSPFYTTIGKIFTSTIPIKPTVFFKLLLSLDFILIFIALFFIAKAFDIKVASLILIFMVLFFGTYGRILGNFLQYPWLFAILMGLSFWKMKKIILSSFFFAYAVMVRIFPIFLLVGLIVKFLYLLIKKIKNEQRYLYSKFFQWFFIFCLLFFIISILGEGFNSWFEFIKNMKIHSIHLEIEEFEMGFSNMLFSFISNIYLRNIIFYLVITAIFLIFISFIRRVRDIESFVVSCVLVYFFLNLSPVYYLILSVIFIIWYPDKNREKSFYHLYLVGGLFIILLYNALFNFGAYGGFGPLARARLEIVMLLYFTLVIIGGWFFTHLKEEKFNIDVKKKKVIE